MCLRRLPNFSKNHSSQSPIANDTRWKTCFRRVEIESFFLAPATSSFTEYYPNTNYICVPMKAMDIPDGDVCGPS